MNDYQVIPKFQSRFPVDRDELINSHPPETVRQDKQYQCPKCGHIISGCEVQPWNWDFPCPNCKQGKRSSFKEHKQCKT